jgi:uncharacterized membrane protein
MRSRWLGVLVVAAMWVAAAAAYGRLPDPMPVHWNVAGEVDSWMPRASGVVIPPLIATGLLALLWLLPRIDPRRENYARFAGEWWTVVNLFVLFLAATQGITLAFSLGAPIDVGRLVIASMGLLFLGIGNYLPRVRSNWFLGIRTPWTLENERVWRDTHRVGGRAFVGGGLMMLGAVLLPAGARPFVVAAAVLLAAGYPLVYSYFAWRREAAHEPRT